MAGLASTTLDLARLQKRWKERIAGFGLPGGSMAGADGAGRLSQVHAFGPNPGALDMFTYVPQRLAAAPALVVVLHGCKQTAGGYDLGSGWSALADEHGFVLVYPQQNRANNPNLCFNWFQPGDIGRDQGEASSIRRMVEHAMSAHSVDRSRIFVTGLSAGGAMAATMLATYPELFAGGSVVAGLPYGAAGNVQEALQAMSTAPERSAESWGDLVRTASAFRGRWPTLSVWHGSADRVVEPANAEMLVRQWTNLHDLPATPSGSGRVDGHLRRTWRDADGREVIETFTIAGMGHGLPLHVGSAAGGGTAGAFMLDVGISSTRHMAAFWGLIPAEQHRAAAANAGAPPRPGQVADKLYEGEILSADGQEARRQDRRRPKSYVESVIDSAFRAAGLRK